MRSQSSTNVPWSRTVAYDGAWVPPAMLGTLLRGLINQRREEDFVVSRFHTLTRRERDVLALITEGRTDHEIGDALYISPQTARTHAHKVLRKLDVHSRLEASILAVDYRLIERIDTQREGT